MINYQIVSRPAGGTKIVVARCNDGRGHVFVYDERMNKLARTAACGNPKVQIVGPLHDADIMCVACAQAATRWAEGAPLEVT